MAIQPRRVVQRDTSWLQFSRVALEWLNPRQDLQPSEWVESVVGRAKAAGINTLAFDFWHGGYAVFNGSIAPKDRHIGEADVIALLDDMVHREGMRLVLMNMGAHCNSYASVEYSSWRVVDPDGRPRNGILSNLMCLNSPYAAYLLQELRGLLPRYSVDGLYIEGLYGCSCYCHYCRTEFRQTYGYEIPHDENVAERNRDCRSFRADVASDFVRRCRELLDTVSPTTAFIPCPSLFEHSWADYRSWAAYADAVALERQWGSERFTCPLFEIGLSMQVVRAESKRPAVGTLWLAWGVDRNYAPCPASHYKLNFAEILLYGATPQVHVQTLFEVDSSELETVREMHDLEGRLQPDLVNANLVHYAALVIDYSNFEISEHFKGYYQALIEAHVPFEVISKRDLEDRDRDLSQWSVVILPNTVRLSDLALSRVAEYCSAGGGLVFTFRTGCENEAGVSRETSVLYPMAGVSQPHGVTTNPSTRAPREGHAIPEVGFPSHEEFQILPQTYYKVRPGSPIDTQSVGRLQSLRGGYLEVTTAGGNVCADALDYDFSKMHLHHPVYGWYPGSAVDPLIVTRAAHSRCVYFAGEFDRDAYRTGHAGLLRSLADAAVWAAEEPPPVEVRAPSTVEIATHYSDQTLTYTIILVNQTTNQLHPGWVVREVQSISDIEIDLRLSGEVADVRSVSDSGVEWDISDGLIRIRIDHLAETEAISVRMAASD